MKWSRLIPAVMICLASLLSFAPTPWVSAAPEIEVVNIYRTVYASGVSGFCGFAVLRHDEGTITFITRYDENGDPVREISVWHLNSTFINEANGYTLSGASRGIDQVIYHPDGSITVMTAGPGLWTRAPGGGHVWGSTGSSVIEIDADGNVTSIRESGPNQSFNPQICSALAP